MESEHMLEATVRRLEEEVGELKARIQELETKVNATDEAKINVELKREEAIMQRSAGNIAPAPHITNKAEQPLIDWENLLFQVWMPRIFIFVFIIGVLWGFKAASEYGLLNEPVKIAWGFILSGSFLFFGHKQMKEQRVKLGHVLLGGSIPLLMLTTFAMHVLYGMVGPAAAFVLNVIWIVLGLVLTRKYQSEVLGIISMVGGVLVPFLIESETPNPYVFLGYETLLYALFLSLSIRYSYLKMYYGSSVLLNSSLLIFYGVAGDVTNEQLVAVPIVIQYILLLYYFVKATMRITMQANTLLTSVFITYAWISGVLTDGYITMFLLVFIGVYAILAYTRRRDFQKATMFDIHLIVLLAFLIIHVVDERLVMSLLLIQGVAAYYSSVKYPSILKKIISLYIYGMAGCNIVCTEVISEPFSIITIEWMVLLVTFVIGARLVYTQEKIKGVWFVTISSILFSVLALTFETQLTLAFVQHMSEDSQRLLLTFVWIVTAIFAIVAGILKENRQAKYIGVALLILTLLKLVLFDISYIPLFIRAILFIALGFVGLLVSRVFYRKK